MKTIKDLVRWAKDKELNFSGDTHVVWGSYSEPLFGQWPPGSETLNTHYICSVDELKAAISEVTIMKPIKLGSNQYFKPQNEDEYLAGRAVHEAVGLDVYAGHKGYVEANKFYGSRCYDGAFIGASAVTDGETLLTLEQVLFHEDAPEWADKVVKFEGSGDICWMSNDDSECQRINGGNYQQGDNWASYKTIATKPKESEQSEPWLPDVGQECEFKYLDGDKTSWKATVAHGYHDGEVWMSIDGGQSGIYDLECFEFRSIKTEREKFTDRVIEVIKPPHLEDKNELTGIANELFEAGCRFKDGE